MRSNMGRVACYFVSPSTVKQAAAAKPEEWWRWWWRAAVVVVVRGIVLRG